MRSTYARLYRRFGKRLSGTERQLRVRKKLKRKVREAAIPPSERKAAFRGRRPHVVIVGAGLGGLMAGYTLARSCDVSIFEARERVGGRVWTKNKSTGIVEAGGELIGYNHPLWLALARQLGLGLSLTTSDTNFDALDLDMPLYVGGEKVARGRLEGLYDEMDKAFGNMAKKAKEIDETAPWLSPGAERLDKSPLSSWIDRQGCSDLAKLAMREQFLNDSGAPAEQQSYLANLAVVAGGALDKHPGAYFTQTETLRCAEGNQALAELLADEIRSADGIIHLSSPINAIDIGEGGVRIESEGGAAQSSDYVVLAIPPSLWPGTRYGGIRITPELPSDYTVSMGTAVKYLSPVKHRFWIQQKLAPTATSSRFGVTWEGTDNQIAPHGREVELSLFAGGTPAHSAIEEWQHGGKTAVDIFYASRIGEVYPAYKDNLSQSPDFIAWPVDPWTGAGYSCPAPGEVMRAGPLLNGAFHKRMYFAGEHTCFAYFGYMEGALQSGLNAGTAIIRAIRRERQRCRR